MHRALIHFRLGPMNVAAAISLFVFFSGLWLVCLPWVCRLWGFILSTGIRMLPLRAELGLAERQLAPYLRVAVPYPRMDPVLPSAGQWLAACAATLSLFAASFLFSQKLLPLKYLLRAILLVQASALLYFALLPARFPHTPDSYLEGLVVSGIGLISTVPLLFALTHYIFDFGLPRKAFLTAITMAHLTLFLPFQVLLQALILQKTVLFMPLLYIIFGMPLDILLIIAFYSWGMTWSFRSAPARNE